MSNLGLDGGDDVPLGGTINTASISATLDTNVTRLTPGSTPRVTDVVVVDGAISAITDNENTVIKLGTASRTGNHTGGVELEGRSLLVEGYNVLEGVCKRRMVT